MKTIQFGAVVLMTLILTATGWAHQRGVTEINEGTVRQVYIDKPLIGVDGYVIADWGKGEVRVEVRNFPASATGYEVFLFEMDVPAYMAKMFVDGDKAKGLVADVPPFDEVAGLISQWQSLGDVKLAANGNGTLEYRGGDDLYAKGHNMIMIFEKVTAGQHAGPEDISKLMVECNGPLDGAKGSAAMMKAMTVLKK